MNPLEYDAHEAREADEWHLTQALGVDELQAVMPAIETLKRERELALQEAGRLRTQLEDLGSEGRALIAEAVRQLDAIGGGEPEGAHSEADEILLACAPPEVREAHRRLVERAEWWAAA